jgi:hypothetical protein
MNLISSSFLAIDAISDRLTVDTVGPNYSTLKASNVAVSNDPSLPDFESLKCSTQAAPLSTLDSTTFDTYIFLPQKILMVTISIF